MRVLEEVVHLKQVIQIVFQSVEPVVTDIHQIFLEQPKIMQEGEGEGVGMEPVQQVV